MYTVWKLKSKLEDPVERVRTMNSQMRNLIWCGLAVSVALVAADASYVGKWKMNVAKSDFGDTTVTFASAPSGGMQMTVDGQTVTR